MAGADADPRPDETPNRAFDAVVDAETIRTATSLVHALVDECHVYLDEDGVRMRAIDPATVALVDLTIERAAFDAYEASGGHVGVNVAQLRDIVGMADRGQPVEFALDPATRKLEIAAGNLEYTLALVDPDAIRSPPDRSGFEFPAEVVTGAEDVHRAVQAADMVSDHVALGVDEDEDAFYVEAEGDTDDVSLELTAADLVEFAPGDAHSLYSIDYLKDIDRAMPSGVETSLELGAESPLAIRYEFGEGAGSVEYFVAPRISNR